MPPASKHTEAAAKHWQARAADYRTLATQAIHPEIRQVLDHLHRVCHELAAANKPDERPRASLPWLHRGEAIREETAERWRSREIEYRAIAENCKSEDGAKAWRAVAQRCAEIADYIERTATASSRADAARVHVPRSRSPTRRT